MRVAYSNFSMWTYQPSIKPHMREKQTCFSLVKIYTTWRYFWLVEISSASVILNKGRPLWKRLFQTTSSIDHFINQWDPSKTRLMEELCKLQGGPVLKGKTHLFTFYESILVSTWTFQLPYLYIYIYIYIYYIYIGRERQQSAWIHTYTHRGLYIYIYMYIEK